MHKFTLGNFTLKLECQVSLAENYGTGYPGPIREKEAPSLLIQVRFLESEGLDEQLQGSNSGDF